MNAGDRIGSWTVVSDKITRVGTSRYLLCECDCGRRKQVGVHSLKNGKSKRCLPCAGVMGRKKQFRNELGQFKGV